MLSLGTEWDQEPLILELRRDHPKRFMRFTEPVPRVPVPKVGFRPWYTPLSPQSDFLAQLTWKGDRSMDDPRGIVRVGKDKITCFEPLSTATEVDNRTKNSPMLRTAPDA